MSVNGVDERRETSLSFKVVKEVNHLWVKGVSNGKWNKYMVKLKGRYRGVGGEESQLGFKLA